MKKIAELLELKPEATEKQILDALSERFGRHTTTASELEKLRSDYATSDAEIVKLRAAHGSTAGEVQRLRHLLDDADDELARLRAIPRRDTPTINAAALAAKRAAGLTRDQALEVLAAQAEHDATDPHDPQPEEEDAD